MAVIETKYSVGDVVYLASTTIKRKQHKCPDCMGSHEWAAISPAGQTYSFSCPRCRGSYRAKSELSLDYSASVPATRRLTIGSIRTDSHLGAWGKDEPVSYMCEETGVGTGNIWSESLLFEKEAEALHVAKSMAAKENEETPWIAKQYNDALSVSDYQLESAAIKEAQDYRVRAGGLLYNLSDLFEGIDSAENMEAVAEAIEDYKRLWWDSDIAELSAQAIEAGTAETQGGSVHESAVRQDAPQ